jgi:hypothetical protein
MSEHRSAVFSLSFRYGNGFSVKIIVSIFNLISHFTAAELKIIVLFGVVFPTAHVIFIHLFPMKIILLKHYITLSDLHSQN